MAEKIENIVSTIVMLSSHPESLHSIVKALARRHVSYGVRGHHVPIMKQAVMGVIQRILNDIWTPSMAKSWNELWDAICEAMTQVSLSSFLVHSWICTERKPITTEWSHLDFQSVVPDD